MTSPGISVPQIEYVDVHCPYCALGFATVAVRCTHNQKQVDTKEPRQCTTCHGYFRVTPRVTLVGLPFFEGAPDISPTKRILTTGGRDQ